MKNYYFGGGIRRSFLTFGGVVPEIKKLDYEVPYVDPSRIYGVDSGGKVYQKNTSTEPQGLKNNHFLESGDCDTNKFSENLTKIGSSKVESLPSNPISQRNLDLNINKNRNKYETLPCTRLHTSMQFNRNMNSSLPSTSLGISSINESMKNTKLDDLKNFITPIKPQDKQVEVYSKVVPNKTPRLNKTWRNYRINVQKKIGKAKFRNTFTIPKFLKNQEKIKNDNDIHIYQDKKELKELCLPTTILNPIIDEPQKLGVAKSLKEEFEMYRQCYKVYKEDTGVEEQLKNSTVQNFEQTKRKESHSMKITITILLLYLLTSCITVFLHLPISLITLIIPVLSIPFTIWGIRYDMKPARHIALNGISTCLCLKLLSILAYYIIFEKDKNNNKIKEKSYSRRIAVLDQKNKEYDMKVLFMAAIILGETIIFILYTFIQWHRVAVKKNKKRNNIDNEVIKF